MVFDIATLPGWTMIITVPLKGYAMWRASRNRDSGWFCLFLLLNLYSIPEIFYLLKLDRHGKISF